MMNRVQRALSIISVSALLCHGGTANADGSSAATGSRPPDAMQVFVRSISADFDTVRFGVESAIENRGYVIDYHARIGEMLERTATDVGAGGTPYTAAETWQFCSALLSRQMVEADPANIAYCPFVVFAYETRNAPGTVVVGFRPGAGNHSGETGEALAAIDRELKTIVAEATE